MWSVMQPPRFEELARALDQFLGGFDPADPAHRKRMRIVEAATEMFIQHGYRKASVEQIARRAGVAKGTVYLYFNTKAELLVYAIAVEKKTYIEALKPILDAQLPAKERLRQYLRTAVTLLARMPLTSRLMGGDREILAVFDDLDADVHASHEALQLDFTTRLLDPAAAPHRWTEQELQDRGRVLLALLYALGQLLDARLRGGLSLERLGNILADMVVDGLCAPTSAGGSGGPS
jgi:AcrR family transcriptional regulator